MRYALRPYQDQALDRVTARAAEGVTRQLGVAATGLGKGLAVGTPVLLATGTWRPVEALCVGDLVVGVDGQATEIMGVFDRGPQPAYRVTTDDDASVVVDGDHLWTVATDSDISRGRPWRTLDTATLAVEGTTDPSGRRRWRLPLVAPVWPLPGTPTRLPIDHYILGVLIADGALTQGSVTFCPGDDEIARRVRERLPTGLWLTSTEQADRATTYRIVSASRGRGSINPLRAELQRAGLWGTLAADKRIPRAYLAGSPERRWDLLAGLLDCDGYQGDATQYTTVSPGLADDVAYLVRSLGGVARITRKDAPTYTHADERRTGQPAYNVTLRVGRCPFYLTRKADAWLGRPRLRPTRKIATIEPVGTAHTVCIKVAASDGLFVTDHHIVTHNTIVFAALAQRMGVRTLVLAHRDELVRQAADKLRQVWPDVPSIGIVKAEENDIYAEVVVASVQTLSRQRRLARLGPRHAASFTEPEETAPEDLWGDVYASAAPPPFGLVVVDEAHHATADSYRRILDHVGAGAPGGPLLLGVTATPDRGDGRGLDDVFAEITFNYDILWGIRSGYLADLRGKAVTVDHLDVASIRTSRGDYQLGDAGRALEEADGPAVIAQAIAAYARDRRTLAFLPTVATSLETAEQCRALGLRTAHIDGETPTPERRSILRGYAVGDYDVVTNCAVLTEGFDEPSVDCVVIGRPTKSRALYTQMVGRGTRLHPDKTDCLVLDIVGAAATHSLVTIPSLFGLPEGDLAERAAGGSAVVSDLVAEHEEREIRAGRLRQEDVELFERVRADGLAWVNAQADPDRRRYVLAVDTLTHAVMVQLDRTDPNSWAVQAQNREHGNRTLIRAVDMETAQAVGEDYARRFGDRRLADPDAGWRTRKPTMRQLDAARRWRLPNIETYATAGELSDAITAHAERRKARRRPAS